MLHLLSIGLFLALSIFAVKGFENIPRQIEGSNQRFKSEKYNHKRERQFPEEYWDQPIFKKMKLEKNSEEHFSGQTIKVKDKNYRLSIDELSTIASFLPLEPQTTQILLPYPYTYCKIKPVSFISFQQVSKAFRIGARTSISSNANVRKIPLFVESDQLTFLERKVKSHIYNLNRERFIILGNKKPQLPKIDFIKEITVSDISNSI